MFPIMDAKLGRNVTSDGTHTLRYTTDGRSLSSSWCWSQRQLLFCHQVASPAMQDGCHLSKVFVSIYTVFTILQTHTHTYCDNITLQQQYIKRKGPPAVQLCAAHYSVSSVFYSS